MRKDESDLRPERADRQEPVTAIGRARRALAQRPELVEMLQNGAGKVLLDKPELWSRVQAFFAENRAETTAVDLPKAIVDRVKESLSLKADDVLTSDHLRQVTSLSLNGLDSQVSDLSPLQGLKALQTLYVSGTQVSDLSPLQGLTALQRLYVHNTQVSDLSPLQGLTALQRLYVSGTQVSDLSPLQGLTALQTLSVHDTQVSDLSPLQGLKALQTLYVSHTNVSRKEIEEFRKAHPNCTVVG